MFHNKVNEDGKVIINKAKFVCKGYAKEEGIDFGETFAPIVRMKSIRNFLTYGSYNKFNIYQMDVKTTFLNGYCEEEVYTEQPDGFESSDKPNHVYQLKKIL